MKRLILNLAVSLDGFITGPGGEYDWCFTDQDYGMTEFLDSLDSIAFGRKSYEELLKLESDPYPGMMKYVFSRTMHTNAPLTEVISGAPAREMARIKSLPGKNIWLFGGAELASSLMNAKLVDELQVAIHPVLLGAGKPLFSNIQERTHLIHTDTKTYSSGLVQVFYRAGQS